MRSLLSLFATFFILFPSAWASEDQLNINQVRALSKQAIELGKVAREKIADLQLGEFNERMIDEHQIMLETISDKADQIKTKLRPLGVVDLKQVRKLVGSDFENAYIDEVMDVHNKLITKLDRAYTPSPIEEELLVNYRQRVKELLDSAMHLKFLRIPPN